jgi:hypothetical protein
MNTYPEHLRQVATFVEQSAPAVMPYVSDGSVSFHLTHTADWRAEAARLQDALGGDWSANAMSDFISLQAGDTILGPAVLFLPRYDTPAVAVEVDVSDLVGAKS